ncbi:hypothetical protein CV769_14985 [Enterococcus mundtii]|uniref:hypothetical protein n=1 Tax=Enterococcus mundtii TaxID=53346 RepID=UPI000C258B65|nr:hypothetical protein [Enterococcus mundtii]PJK24534.1 hypothetical protein CV769_14985 [Enterococcus mundtii]
MLERYKEDIKVQYEKEDSKEKRNQKRNEAIEEHFNDHFILDKKLFSHYIQRHHLADKDQALTEEIRRIDFTKANPRNSFFINELAFAGEAITEGFLDCFNIERSKAIEKYKAQLQVIERKESSKKTAYFIGTFDENKLLRLSPYQERMDKLAEIVKEKEQQRLIDTRQEGKQQNNVKNIGLIRKREEEE